LRRIGELCFADCSLKSICIPNSVEDLDNGCFSHNQIATITFEAGSRLRRIGELCFSNCSLQSICVQPSV
jgi:hypothetical protein